MSDIMNKLFLIIPKNYQEGYELLQKQSIIHRISLVSFLAIIIQITFLLINLKDPFSNDPHIMLNYYIFYIICITINFILIIIKKVLVAHRELHQKKLEIFSFIYLYYIMLWSVGVGIADQYQGENIVVYYLAMITFAIFFEMYFSDFLIMLILTYFIFSTLIYNLPLDFSNRMEVLISSSQFVVFALFLRYRLSEFSKKNYVQQRKLNELNEALDYSATHDHLSTLYNRRGWEASYYDMVQTAIENQSEIAIIIIDIDYFKQYNDIYGHVKGDEIIVQISEAITDVFRGANIGRYGGDEFIISMTDISKTSVLQLIDLLKLNVLIKNIPHEGSVIDTKVTISIGFYMSTIKSNDNFWNHIAIADKNLYLQKSSREKAPHLQ